MLHLKMSWLSSFLLAAVLLFPAGDAAMLGGFYCKRGESLIIDKIIPQPSLAQPG